MVAAMPLPCVRMLAKQSEVPSAERVTSLTIWVYLERFGIAHIVNECCTRYDITPIRQRSPRDPSINLTTSINIIIDSIINIIVLIIMTASNINKHKEVLARIVQNSQL